MEPQRPAHRPLKFQTVEALQSAIDEYFVSCDNRKKKINTKIGIVEVPNPEPYTMSGLAYKLKCSRQTLINYENRDEFLDTIKEARNRVEMDVERRMNDHETFTPGLIFNAKNNFGWHDKTEVEQSGGIDLNVNSFLEKIYGNPTTEPTSTT